MPRQNKDFENSLKYPPARLPPSGMPCNAIAQKAGNPMHRHVARNLPLLFPIAFHLYMDPIVPAGFLFYYNMHDIIPGFITSNLKRWYKSKEYFEDMNNTN